MPATQCVVRTLRGDKLPIDLPQGTDTTVAALTDLLCAQYDYAYPGLRLVWNGNVLADASTHLHTLGWTPDAAHDKPFVAVGRPKKLQYTPPVPVEPPADTRNVKPPRPTAPPAPTAAHVDPCAAIKDVPAAPEPPQWPGATQAPPQKPPAAAAPTKVAAGEAAAAAAAPSAVSSVVPSAPSAQPPPPPPPPPPETQDDKIATLTRLGFDRNMCRYVIAQQPGALLSQLIQTLKDLQAEQASPRPQAPPLRAPPQAAASMAGRSQEERTVITALMALGILGVNEDTALEAYYENGRDVQSAANALLGIS